MKVKLMILSLLVVATLSAHTQGLKDSTTIPNSQLRIALQLVEQGRQCEQESTLLKSKIELLYDKIELKDSIIQSINLQVQTKDNIIGFYKSSEANLLLQKSNYESQVKSLTKQVKVQKAKKAINGILGVAAVIGVTIFFLK